MRRRPTNRPASQYVSSKVGFPIRKSSDQSSFAAPQGLSQRTTSFIASQRQGIHRMPLIHLITLMIDARDRPGPVRHRQKDHWIGSSRNRSLAEHARTTAWSNAVRVRRELQGEPSAIGHIPSSRCQISRPRCDRELFDLDDAGNGGARRDRTDDLMLAKHALSQLSYGPGRERSRQHGGPGTTRTSDLTLIRGAL